MEIEQKIEHWKNKLLDFSKRNKLIHCTLPKSGKRVSRTTLLLKKPNPETLWKKLSSDDDSVIQFPVSFEDYQDDALEETEENDKKQKKEPLDTVFSNGIETNQSRADACKTLKSLMKKSREFAENKGLNGLYLAFGFLNWKENGVTGQEMRSPLLLIPVAIAQETLMDPIELSRIDAEIISKATPHSCQIPKSVL